MLLSGEIERRGEELSCSEIASVWDVPTVAWTREPRGGMMEPQDETKTAMLLRETELRAKSMSRRYSIVVLSDQALFKLELSR